MLKRIVLLMLASSWLCVSPLLAEPKTGIGYALGPAGVKLSAGGDAADVQASGLMGLLDFQWGLADWFSANFLIINSQGKSGAAADNEKGWNVGLVGVQARFWLDSWFLGWGQGNANVSDGGVSLGAKGGGVLALGVEGESWSLQWVQVGSGDAQASDGLKASASGILLGYRW